MPVFPRLSVIVLIGLMAGPVRAADAPHLVCLNKAEQRATVANHHAVPLAQAIKSVRRHHRTSELVRARLCHRGEGLVYVLTLLAHNGKVLRVAVDAANGALIKGH